MLSPVPPGVQVLLLALVLGAAVFDARYRRIPNWLTVAGVLVGLAMNTYLYGVFPTKQVQGSWGGLLFAAQGLGFGFGVYLFLYVLRAMGAGDVKLMAAVGAMAGWRDWFGIFVLTAVIGGALAVIVSVARGRLGKTLFNVGFILSEMRNLRPAYLGNEELDVRSDKALRMPHGVIIAMGTLVFLALNSRAM